MRSGVEYEPIPAVLRLSHDLDQRYRIVLTAPARGLPGNSNLKRGAALLRCSPGVVRDPLPIIPVRLQPEDPPVDLALKPCLDWAFDEARYDCVIDYGAPPDPPLMEPDATWARELVAGR